MRMFSFTTHSPQDTFSFGRALGQSLLAGDVVLLSGDLGAGKSVLARGIAAGLGISGPMPSPTFTLMQPYENGRVPFYHFDLYRLDGEDEFEAAGLTDYLGTDGVEAVEWPECTHLEPSRRIEVSMSRGDGDDDRALELRLFDMDARAEAIAQSLLEWRNRS